MLTVLALLGFLLGRPGGSGPAGQPEALDASGRPGAGSTAGTPVPSQVAASSSPRRSPRPSPSPSASVKIPRSGPGTFTTAPGAGAGTGGSHLLRYAVSVEDGIGLSLRRTATEVDGILADSRGWTADGRTGFRRVPDAAGADFVVEVATPATVDHICGQYGLDTGGEVNCRVGKQVMVNLERWIEATPVYADDVPSYRALIINHEVGHFLGHGHESCPGTGRPAPVMMQQIKGMHGCVPNVWPFRPDGTPIAGPQSGP